MKTALRILACVLIPAACLASSGNSTEVQILGTFSKDLAQTLKGLNHHQISWSSERFDVKTGQKTTHKRFAEFQAPCFRLTLKVTDASGKTLVEDEYAFDGSRYYLLLGNSRLNLSAHPIPSYYGEMVENPVLIPWSPLLLSQRDQIVALIGGSEVIMPKLSIDKESGQILLSQKDNETMFSQGVNGFPVWESKSDYGWTKLIISDWLEYPEGSGNKVPKIAQGDTLDKKGGRVILQSRTVLESIKALPEMPATYFAISPDRATTVWDNDRNVLLK